MKTNLLKRKEGRPLSSKFLRLFALIAVLLVGVNGVWAWKGSATVTLTSQNSCTESLAKATLSGVGSEYVEVGDAKYYKLSSDDSYVKIEFVNGDAHYRFMPGDILKVTATTSAENGYYVSFRLKNKDRTSVSEGQNVSYKQSVEISHTLTADDINDDGTISIFRTGNSQGHAARYYKFSVQCVRYGNDIFVSSNNTSLGTANLQVTSGESNVALNTNATAASVGTGATVKFYATPATGMLLHEWKVNGTDTWNGSNPYTIENVDGSKDVQAVFTKGVKIYAISNNPSLGTVKINHWGADRGDYYHITPYPGSVNFVATKIAGEFEGWYADEACTQLVSTNLTYETPNTDGAPYRITNQEEYKLYAKFSSNTDDSTIGTSDWSKAWFENSGDGAYSKTYEVVNYHEYTFTFDCARGNVNNEAWNSWVVTGSKTDRSDTKFILRPDSWVIDNDTNGDGNVDGNDTGKANPAVATADGSPLNWEQFKADLNGAHVTVKVSYDMNTHMVYVYEVIESADRSRKYTYHYPYLDTKNELGDRIAINIGVDRSQLTNFTATDKQGYKVNTTVTPDNSGTIVMTNDEGTSILEGSIVGKGTRITLTATAKEGFAFKNWSSGETTNVRYLNAGDYISGYTHNIEAVFENLDNYRTIWALTNYATTSPVYSAEGEAWVKSGNWMLSRLKEGEEFTGAYRNADGTGELASFAGLLFNGKVAITNYNSDHVKLYANGGVMKVPVKAGQVLQFNAKTDSGNRDLTVLNTNGTTISCPITNGSERTFYVTAANDGYITLSNNTDKEHQIRLLSVSYLNDFTFEDGVRIAAQPGSYGYINKIAQINPNVPLVDGAQYIWTSSNPADVRVDANTGAITVNESFSGNVTITATRQAKSPYPSLAKSYVVEVGDFKLKYDDKTPHEILSSNGTVTYWQRAKVTNNADVVIGSDIDITYKVVSTTSQSAIITQDETTGQYSLNVVGAGVTVVMASAGAISDTYTFTAEGIYFAESAPVLRHDGSGNMPTSYQQAYSGLADGIIWSLVEADNVGVTANINPSTGEIANISGAGILVVQASNSTGALAQYCLTVPKELDSNGYASWDFYDEATDGTSPIQFGSLARIGDGEVLGSAAQVSMIGGDLDFNVDYVRDDKKTDAKLIPMLKRRRHWLNIQADNSSTPMYKTWNYTFKTFQREKIDGVFKAWYANEELFSYGGIVNGDNGRIVKNTAGLIFRAQKDKWGVNDAHDATSATDHRDPGVDRTKKADREKDRSVLMCAGTSMTIPEVKKGNYVRILWYRHSDNAGDRFNVENGIDLDGKKINPTDNLRFTGSQYNSEYKGYTIFRVGDPDNDQPYYDVKITAAVNGWTEIYHIDITDDYETDFQICQVKVFRNAYDDWDKQYRDLTVNDDDHARDINAPDWYNSDKGTNPNAYGWDLSDDWKYASRLTSRIQTNAKGRGLIQAAPEMNIMGHPGQTRGWSGWLNITLAAEKIEGTAHIDLETDNSKNRNNVYNMIPNEQIRIGHDLNYTLPHLTGLTGTGAIKLVFRTHSGAQHTEEPHYTLNKTEAWIAVGEYSVQEYPYTWDFTKYNMDRENRYESEYVTLNQFGASRNVENKYGNYDSNMAMQASEIDASDGYSIGNNPIKTNGIHNMQPRHKRFFAQGAQLTIGDNADRKYTILETEGLRFRLNDGIKDAGDGDVKFVAAQSSGSKQRKAWGDAGQGWTNTYLEVNNVTITIPEVQKGMFVFVKSDSKPTNVTGAVDKNSNEPTTKIHTITDESTWTSGEVSMEQQDVKTGVWVYEQTTDGKQDVSITVSGKIEAIGVTDIFKILTVAANKDKPSWMTESRAERVDYNNNELFTNHKLTGYISTVKTTKVGDENKDCGTLNLVKKQVIDSKNNVSGNKGLVMSDETSVSITASGDQTTTRNIVPLFVPACNIPNDDISDNLLIDAIDGLANLPASTNDCYNYILTNSYWNASQADGLKGDRKIAEDINFYIVRQAGPLRKNSAYFSMNPASAANVRNFYLVFGEEDDVVGIEQIGNDDAEVTDNPEVLTIHTLNGMKLNGLPTQRGIYIINGKKVLVK